MPDIYPVEHQLNSVVGVARVLLFLELTVGGGIQCLPDRQCTYHESEHLNPVLIPSSPWAFTCE